MASCNSTGSHVFFFGGGVVGRWNCLRWYPKSIWSHPTDPKCAFESFIVVVRKHVQNPILWLWYLWNSWYPVARWNKQDHITEAALQLVIHVFRIVSPKDFEDMIIQDGFRILPFVTDFRHLETLASNQQNLQKTRLQWMSLNLSLYVIISGL